MSRIFHIAAAADWTAAQRSGTYTTSTLGRTLAEDRGIRCVMLDYDAMRGLDNVEHRLF